MLRFSANYIFPITGSPIRNGIVEVDDSGRVVEIIDPMGEALEKSSTGFYNGVIVPGFVNTHCHTELSHFRGKLRPETGLSGFVEQVRSLRIENVVDSESDIKKGIDEMSRQGIVAVADICNTSDSFFAKQNSSIRFVNLMEILGLDESKAEIIIEHAKMLKEFPAYKAGDTAYLTPHSTYTLSQKLWSLLGNELKESRIISVHLGESQMERELTEKKEGKLAETFQSWGFSVESIPVGTPVDIVQKYIPTDNKVLFVHNTFLKKDEVVRLKQQYRNATFVLCPASNLFIEKALPDMEMLVDTGVNITLGTDSLASSSSLSILDQLNLIIKSFPQLTFSQILEWATINGARALGMEEEIGSIEIVKKPGLILIYPFDFGNMKPLPHSKVKRLV